MIGRLRTRVTTILGGPGPTYIPERVVRVIDPDWMVRGDGEPAVADLVRSGFALEALPVRRINATAVLESAPVLLDEVEFARPYSLEFYGFEASPRVQTGCSGKCIFCLGAYQARFSYVSEGRFAEMFRYLVRDKNAQVISPCGPDFTAVPAKANGLVEAALRSGLSIRAFRPGVRLDTLHAAIRLRPDLWRQLSTETRIRFESSIESFDQGRLARLGKNVKSEFLARVFEKIQEIMGICPSTIILGRIALDPTITIDEFIHDSDSYIRLLETFPEQVTVGGMIMNEFVPLWGTPSLEKGEDGNPWATPERLHDPAVAELKRTLLDHPRFRLWCGLAQRITDLGERNLVFREILRVARERAEELKRVQVPQSSFCASAAEAG